MFWCRMQPFVLRLLHLNIHLLPVAASMMPQESWWGSIGHKLYTKLMQDV
jgi:hypothetical protein